MATQIEILEQQNKLLAQISDNIETQNKGLKSQNELYSQIVGNIKKMNASPATQGAQQLTQALQETSKESNNAASAQTSFYEEVKKQLKETGEETILLKKTFGNMLPMTRKLAVALSFWTGLKEGIRGVVAVGRSMTSILFGAGKVLGHLALSIVSFPFALLKNLIGMASQSGDNELARQLEEIRKEFGYLNKTAGGAVITLARSLKGELANSGLSTYRVFGNLVERLQYFFEYAKNLGETMDAAMRRINLREDAEALGAFNKALGFTAEGQKAIAQRAIATGESINEVNRQIANYSIQLSDAFGVTMKEVSRDVGKMMADIQHFGHLSVKEMTQAAVYTRRLGIEFKQLSSVMDKFTNFEDAAQGVAQLSQAFGLNIDAFKLMQEQDPSKKLETIRKAFFSAGRSIESMTYQERRLLAQQTGLDDAGVKLAFSLKSQSMSYDEISKKGDQAKKKQLTQAEAIQKLAGAIERMVKSGNIGGGGFLERFLRGFEVGVKRSREFREIMINLRRALVDTYYAGIKVGMAFVKSFPGIRDWFKGISAIFQPAKFRNMLNKVVGAFREFFTDLQTDPRAGFRKFMENLKTNFTSWFTDNKPNGQRVLSGFKKFFVVLSGAFAEGLKMAMQGVSKAMNFIAEMIRDPQKALQAAKGGAGAASWVVSLLEPIWQAIKEAWPGLKAAFINLFTAAAPKIKSALGTIFERSWPLIAASMFGPAFARGVITALGGSLTRAVGKGISSILPNLTQKFKGLGNSLSSAIPGGASKSGQGLTNVIRSQGEVGSAIESTKVNWKSAILKGGLIAAFISFMTFVVLPKVLQLAGVVQAGGLTTESIAKVVGALVSLSAGMALISFSVSGIIKASQTISAGNIGRSIVGLGLIAAVGLAMAYSAKLLIVEFSQFNMSQIAKTVLTLGAIGTFYAVAAGIVAVAGVVGVAALAGSGLGLVAILAGLTTIAATVHILATQGLTIMKEVDRFKITGSISDFTTKTKTFVSIMETIARFSGSVAQMISATAPGILDFIRGDASKNQQKILGQVESIISTLGQQMVNIINVIRTNVQQLRGSETELKSAQIIGDLLSGVGNFATALRPPSEILNEPDFMAQLSLDGTTQRIQAVTIYAVEVSGRLNQFIKTLKTLITQDLANGITDQQKNAISVFPTLLAGVGDLAQAMRPSASFIAEANRGRDFYGIMRATSMFIGDVLQTLRQSGIFEKVAEVITVMSAGIGSLNETQAKALLAMAPVIGPVFSTIGSISAIIASVAGRGAAGDQARGQQNIIRPADAGQIYQMVNLINTFFNRISTDLPALLTNLTRVFQGISKSQASTISSGLESLSKIFEVLPKIPETLTALKSFRADSLRGDALTNDSIIVFLDQFNRLLSGGTAGQQGLVRIIDRLVRAFGLITSSISNPARFAQNITSIKSIFEILSSIPTLMQNLRQSSGNTDVIPTNVMQQPLMNLSRVINSLVSPTIDGTIPNPLLDNRLQKTLLDSKFSGISAGLKNKVISTITGITGIIEQVTGIRDQGAAITQGIQALNANMVGVTNFLVISGPQFVALNQNVPTFINQIKDISFAHVTRNIKKIIDELNALSEATKNIGPIDINAPIRNVANILGVRQEEYRIKHNGMQVNINLNVAMEARTIETALVDSPTSRIQIRPVQGLPPLRFRR